MGYDRSREVKLELSHAREDAGEVLVGWLLVGQTAEEADLSRFLSIGAYETNQVRLSVVTESVR